ncbi:xanthine dehydrogenase family protein molybdopterin-binding subunit [Prauserella muralis]|uniref:Xanthine dehydrogenase n=1 Tax=Prauserella muralis TaxID=588067 RepID=A0A2V4AKV6_9PSEU|nr:xanthine dehydrogenase family protein molybdopterin-binding subunit [Prauserella muralis]PXY19483.1 xanthine dehydrogenase [Prauserella muralis]TWE29460.1 xanthine dehydrogenase YagR molybdenum-binding subunit [Prauserella muralis]
MTNLLSPSAMGTDRVRVDGAAKVTGRARYACEHPVPHPVYLHPLQATIARGTVRELHTDDATALPGVLTVLTPFNAPPLETGTDAELEILQSPEVAFRGQLIGAVLAETPEIARQAAGLVRARYDREPHDVTLSADRDDLYAPEVVNPSLPTDTHDGDPDAAFAAAQRAVEATYTTPMLHNNPMEPHATIAIWDSDGLTLYDSTQGVHAMREVVTSVFGLEPDQVRVLAPYVGGGFGSKGTPHANLVLAVLAAKRTAGRPVKFAVTRQQMFSFVGYRTPTIQRVRLGADADGRLVSISNDVVEQTARIKEFAEQTGVPARSMYAAPNRRTTHRLAALDVPVPSWMRAPGECPGMFAPEVAMDELAEACGLDPIELRVRNEPETDPDSGLPFSSRNLVACLREGARRFGWDRRPRLPRSTLDGGWWVGTGVASSSYPVHSAPGSSATVRATGGGRYEVLIGAVDIGTGAWTVLTQIAADALAVPAERVDVRIGDTDLPEATVAGGSSGTTNWGSAIVEAAREFRQKFGADPHPGDELTAGMPELPGHERFAMRAFGAQFAEVRVNADTGEVRVPRLLGVFAAGRILNPRTARSQFIGGMTMGLSMALHEESVVDERFGFVVNHDLAEYHIASCADVASVQAHWLDEHDPHVNPMGSKGIGEIGIVGTAAAVANAAYHATGVRVRDLPIKADEFLEEAR